ncbi:MAG: carboxypeptidase regulatory-like domain-containing protein [Candidatus Hydrogenedentota bacterium]
MLAYAAALLCTLGQAGEIAGRVVDPAGDPIPEARVFAEPGLAGSLTETQTGDAGRFRFDDVPAGPVGIMAWAEGYAFGGTHVNLGAGAQPVTITITLAAPVTLSGRVRSAEGGNVEGAKITRVALLGESKVGIPFGKLAGFGFDTPVSDADGRFSVPHLPASRTVVLKIGHPEYAQEAVPEVSSDAGNVRIKLYRGVLVEGSVVSHEEEFSVANAMVVIRNARPPHDSALARTDGRGRFSVRLKPGVYLYRAEARSYRSPGWTRLAVTGEMPVQSVTLPMAGAGLIRGVVKDALDGDPVSGVRVLLETQGNIAASVYTGASGTFEFEAAAGKNTVRVHPAPGYLPPPKNTVRVMLEEGENRELPGFWLAPTPKLEVAVADHAGEPAPGALVRVLRPYQFGWQVADANGRLTLDIGSFPADGVIAAAEHRTKRQGALFTLDRDNTDGALVQLFPYARVTGRVADSEGHGIEGVIVGGVFPGERPEEETLLWRCVSGAEGAFSWNAVVPGVPQRCLVQDAEGAEDAFAQSRIFNAAPESTEDLDTLVIGDAEGGVSLHGQELAWWELPRICGPAPPPDAHGPALIIYADTKEAPLVLDGLGRAQEVLASLGVQPVAVLTGAVQCDDPDFPVLRGERPGAASTCLVDKDGVVAFETAGMPPLHALRGL